MYKFRDKDAMKIYNKAEAAKEIGLAPETLRRVVTGTQLCSKLVAYCITKFIDSNSEIKDYFDYVDKEE